MNVRYWTGGGRTLHELRIINRRLKSQFKSRRILLQGVVSSLKIIKQRVGNDGPFVDTPRTSNMGNDNRGKNREIRDL